MKIFNSANKTIFLLYTPILLIFLISIFENLYELADNHIKRSDLKNNFILVKSIVGSRYTEVGNGEFIACPINFKGSDLIIKIKLELNKSNNQLEVDRNDSVLIKIHPLKPAVAELFRVLKSAADNVTDYCNKAHLKDSIGEFTTALKYLDSAISIDNSSTEAWCEKGYALEELNKPQEAKIAYLTSIQLDTENVAAYYSIGDFLIKQSQKDSGCFYIKKSIQLGDSDAIDFFKSKCNEYSKAHTYK